MQRAPACRHHPCNQHSLYRQDYDAGDQRGSSTFPWKQESGGFRSDAAAGERAGACTALGLGDCFVFWPQFHFGASKAIAPSVSHLLPPEDQAHVRFGEEPTRAWFCTTSSLRFRRCFKLNVAVHSWIAPLQLLRAKCFCVGFSWPCVKCSAGNTGQQQKVDIQDYPSELS